MSATGKWRSVAHALADCAGLEHVVTGQEDPMPISETRKVAVFQEW